VEGLFPSSPHAVVLLATVGRNAEVRNVSLGDPTGLVPVVKEVEWGGCSTHLNVGLHRHKAGGGVKLQPSQPHGVPGENQGGNFLENGGQTQRRTSALACPAEHKHRWLADSCPLAAGRLMLGNRARAPRPTCLCSETGARIVGSGSVKTLTGYPYPKNLNDSLPECDKTLKLQVSPCGNTTRSSGSRRHPLADGDA